MSNNETIRVGIVGAGNNTRLRHIPGLQEIEGVEIVSVVNRSRESSQRVASEFGIPKVYDSWKELVEAPDTSAIVIGTWPYLHYPITMAAIAANKHVLCEARMAMNAWEARQMWDAARARPDLVTQIVPSPFSLHVDKTIQRLIREGYLGDILAIEVNASNGNFLDPQGPLHWRHDFDLSGYNIMALGIWYEALMRWVGTAKTVTANGKTFVNQRKDAESGSLKSIQIPDRLAVLADMVCGAQASLLLSDVDGGVKRFEATLYGSEGTIRFANGELSGIRRGDNGFSPISIPDEEKGEWQVEAEFIQAIRGQRVVTHTTFADGVKYMEFTEAVSRSMLENKTISLPLSPQS